MAKLDKARWWEIRRARNSKPATYRCPICGHHLHAGTDRIFTGGGSYYDQAELWTKGG